MVNVIVTVEEKDYKSYEKDPNWVWKFTDKYVSDDVMCGYGFYGAKLIGNNQVEYTRGKSCD